MRSFVCAAVLAGANQLFAPYGSVSIRGQEAPVAVPVVQILPQAWPETQSGHSSASYTSVSSLAAFALGFGGVMAASTYARAGKVRAQCSASFTDPEALRGHQKPGRSSYHSSAPFSDPLSYRGMHKTDTSGAVHYSSAKPVTSAKAKTGVKIIGSEFADPASYRSTPVNTVPSSYQSATFSDLSAVGQQTPQSRRCKRQPR